MFLYLDNSIYYFFFKSKITSLKETIAQTLLSAANGQPLMITPYITNKTAPKKLVKS